MIERVKVARRLSKAGMRVTESGGAWVLAPDESQRRRLQARVIRAVSKELGDAALARFLCVDLDGSSQVLVMIDDDDDAGSRLLMITRVPCDQLTELGEEDRATVLDEGYYLREGADGELGLWTFCDVGERVPRSRGLRQLAEALLARRVYGGAHLVFNLLRARTRRRLDAVAAARGPRANCLVEEDADGDLRWESSGFPPVFLRIVPGTVSDSTERLFRLLVFSAFPMSDGGGSAPEAFARLQAEHPDTQWATVVGGAQRQLHVVAEVPVPPALTAGSLDAAISLIEAAAADAERHADSLGIVSSKALAGSSTTAGPPASSTASSDEHRREQLAADLAAIVDGRDGVRLIRHDSLDRPIDGASVVLRDTTDDGGSRLLVAALDDAGDLIIRGQDSGPAVTAHFGAGITRTEWVRRVAARDVPKLIRHLHGLPGESPLETLARRGDGALEYALLVRRVVRYQDDHWES